MEYLKNDFVINYGHQHKKLLRSHFLNIPFLDIVKNVKDNKHVYSNTAQYKTNHPESYYWIKTHWPACLLRYLAIFLNTWIGVAWADWILLS